MSAGVRQKDPESIVNFTLDWADHIAELGGGITIVGSVWTVPAGLTEVSDSFTTTVATVRVSGGVDGEDYDLVNHVTFSDGQEDESSLTVQVRQIAAGALTDAQKVIIAEITLESYATINTLAPVLNAAQKESLKKDLTTWTAIRDSHVRLSGEVDFDNERKRQAIRARVRKMYGLPLYSEEVIGTSGSFAIPNIPVF